MPIPILNQLYLFGSIIIRNIANAKKFDACDETYPYNPPGPALLIYIIDFKYIS
jgi:hypothetical protein